MKITIAQKLLLAAIISLVALSGYGVQHYLSSEREIAGATLIRPEFAMADLDGKIRNIKEWDGQVILLNFWATWCPPCLSEIPGFMELQAQYGEQGFQVIGIAIDDEESVREFATNMNMNYPVMAGEFEAIELSSRYGNQIGGLPYSVIINREGKVVEQITGELRKIEAEALLKKSGLKS